MTSPEDAVLLRRCSLRFSLLSSLPGVPVRCRGVPSRCRRGSRCCGAARGGGAGRDAAADPPPSIPPALPAGGSSGHGSREQLGGSSPWCLCPGQRGHGGQAALPPLEPPELPEPPRDTGATGAAGMSALAFDDSALEGLAPSLGLSGASDIDTALLSDIDGASRRGRDGAWPGLGA